MALGHQRGHQIYYDHENGIWRYCSDKKPINKERPCTRCKQSPTVEGYDACLGHIEGVQSACCGHGISKPIMVMEKDEG